MLKLHMVLLNQKDKEILMLYTCYPVNGLGHKTDRFVVYAERIN